MNYLDLEEVIEIHDLQIDLYGGEKGISNYKELDSCLMNPLNSFNGVEFYPGIVKKAARLCFNICTSHPFIDGNKRTEVQVLETTLNINSIELEISDNKLRDLILELVTHQINFETFYLIIKNNSILI